MHTHEERPERSGRRAVEPRRAAADLQAGHGDRPTHDAVLRLQHSVGNQVVARTLAGDLRRDAAEDEPSTVPDVLGSPGRPLDTTTRTEFEARFGADFADVRVHTGAAAERSATEIGARAYTSGNHVVIGEQGGDPHTMAHELTHVIQQRQGPVRGGRAGNGLRVSDPDDEFERAAEATATEVLRAPRQAVAHRSEPSVVYRAPSTKPDPVLTATPVSGEDKEGLCGNFVRARSWNVANPVKGLVIQKVTRAFNVESHQDDDSWTPISGGTLDSYVTEKGASVHAATTEYWEVWVVGPKGGFTPDGRVDTFGMTSLIPKAGAIVDSTKGNYRISGEAYFYPTDADPADLGFARRAVQAAGGLFSRTTNPAGDLTAKGVTAVGSAVTYTVTVSWNSTNSTDLDDGYPRLAWSDVQAH